MQKVSYHQDLAAWAEQQAALLQAGNLHELDIENLIEEMQAMSRKEHRELLHRMQILIAHLLKREYQPTHRGVSWIRTIDNQRLSINGLIEDSPSLKNHFDEAEWIAKAWKDAVKLASNETGLGNLPPNPIWTIDEILNKDFFQAA